MIITHLIGGLGNQMFQYAAGRAVAADLNVPLLLDVSDFKNYRLHNGFELSRIFTAQMPLASQRDVAHCLGWQANRFLKRLIVRKDFDFLRRNNFIAEPHFHYWNHIQTIMPNSYLYGYWQSERYFSEIKDIIRTDFQFKNPLEGMNADLAKTIGQSNAISMHIRRGDYLQNPKNLKRHGVCSLGYYKLALDYLIARVSDPVVFVFSDDIEWARSHLELQGPSYFISHNTGPDSYKDMHLMSLCKHHIIANSSFSWWGAWLASTEEQVVVAPHPWFEDPSMDARDLALPSWHLLQRNA